jgi:CHAT domain-containing protein
MAAAERYNRLALGIKRKQGEKRSLVYSELNEARLARARNAVQEAEQRFHDVIAAARELDEPQVLWEAQADLASLCRTLRRDSDAQAQYQAGIGTIQQEWRKLVREESKLTFLAQLIEFYRDYVDFLVEGGRTGEALQVAESARARVLAEKLGLHQEPSGSRIGELQRVLARSNAVVLDYWLGTRRSFLWVIMPRGISQFTLPPSNEIAGLVDQYTRVLLNRSDPLDRGSAAGRLLWDVLLEPVRTMIPPGATAIVIPDGALYRLSFETLVVPGPKPHYWIEDAAVKVAPSINVLQGNMRTGVARRNLLFIGDPRPPGNDFAPLPHLTDEYEIVRREFPAVRGYTREAAWPGAYREAGPGAFGFIHFAAHATPNQERPLESAIILSPRGQEYKLYVKDVVSVPLEAELVTVSACRSAGSRTYSGEGLIGFAWAFLQAGAGNVVAGIWDVDDAATSKLMDGLYAGLARGEAPAAALRRAKLGLLRSGTMWRKPFFWAPFEVFTRYAAT